METKQELRTPTGLEQPPCQVPPVPPSYLLPLLQLCDSALPNGAFSHSFGLETYLARGVVHDEESFTAWLRQFISQQLVYSDGLAIRLVIEALERTALGHHREGARRGGSDRGDRCGHLPHAGT